ncbi:MAG: hypothetical protein Q9166_001953 [cf. Caloplaca sp. 2 TL-2023]
MASKQPVGLLYLPCEIRIEILGYLLPNQRFILQEAYDKDYKRYEDNQVISKRVSPPSWSTFDYKSNSPFPEVLLTNRQIYSDGFYYLYHLKTFKLVIQCHDVKFLSVKNSSLVELPPLPYNAMKEFSIEIHAHDMGTTACALRINLIRLLRLFRINNIHFKKLRIQFPEPLGPMTGWESSWDASEPKAWDFNPEVIDYNGNHDTHNEIMAQESGAPSTFAWVLCVIAVCPGLADECIIELPNSLSEKPHMQACAKWYAEGLDGRALFLEAEEWCLKSDLYDVTHEYGQYSASCECDDCEEVTRSEWVRVVRHKLAIYRYELKCRWLSFWESVYAYPACAWRSWNRYSDDVCGCEWCVESRQQNLRKQIMDLEKLGHSTAAITDDWSDDENLRRWWKHDDIHEKSEARSWFGTLRRAGKGLWRRLCDYPYDFWFSWTSEVYDWAMSGYCSCRECNGAVGWLQDGSSRLSLYVKMSLIGNMIKESIWGE